MNDIPKGKSLRRCIELCRKQLTNVKADVIDIEREEEETDLEKLDAIFKAVERIERSCHNIREYARECNEY